MEKEQNGAEEIYAIFSRSLHEQLKNRINASIYVRVSGDELFVKISRLGVNWDTAYPNLLHQIVTNKSSKDFADEIVKLYKKEVLHRYFY